MPPFRRLLPLPAMLLLFSLVACSSSAPPLTTGNGTPAPAQAPVKPSPRVIDVTGSTAGDSSGYYVILDASLKNDGTEGIVEVVASVTQAGKTATKEVSTSMGKGSVQNVRFVFPLIWKGGDWQPTVTAGIP